VVALHTSFYGGVIQGKIHFKLAIKETTMDLSRKVWKEKR